MTRHTLHDEPYGWLSSIAASDPARPCLLDDASALSYGEVRERVDTAADRIESTIGEFEIVPVEVNPEAASAIEVLAIQKAGGVPMPHEGAIPLIPTPVAPGGAVCVQTSGSSGVSRIVPLTYSNIAASARASRARITTAANDRWLDPLPLHHVGGLSILWRTLESGGSAIIAPFDESGASIEKHRPTIASLVPTMLHRLHRNNPAALASLRFVLVGGASLDQGLWERCELDGIAVVPTYGSTEAGSQIATAKPGATVSETGWVGPPLDSMTVRILNDDGAPLDDGASGSIAIDGPAVFAGYLGDQPRLGLFVTNDLGRIDATGDLHVEGRRDDMVVSGGENVSLDHVARTLRSIDGIVDVCVVGIPDAEWGTIVAAMVVTSRDLATFDTMVTRDLKPHERPKRWLHRTSIPELANGKHDAGAVRAEFEEVPWT